jgi:sortase (surface protein transpeptidase)
VSRWTTIAAVATGLALVVGAPIAWLASRGPDRVGSLEVADGPSDADVATAAATPPPSSTPTAATSPSPAPEARASSDPLAAIRPVEQQRPARIRIPALGVDATIVEVGVEPDGGMEIPTDVTTVGWYRHGPTPGATGSSVLAGHVDSRTQGRGAFFDLRRLAVGDRVEVEFDDGTTTTFEVQGRDVVDKEVVPLEDVFDRDGPARVTLVTCGGDFDAGARSYESNVVVVAVPVEA